MIVVFGTLCLDRIHLVPKLARKGGYVEIAQTHVTLGGEALNTATALTKWGDECVLAGNSLGRGFLADFTKRKISEANLPEPLVPSFDHTAPVCDIYVTPDGERTMFGEGFIQMEDRSDPSVFPLISDSWFTADPNLGRVSRFAALRAAHAGMKVYLMDFNDEADHEIPTDIWQSSTDRIGREGDIQANMAWMKNWLPDHPWLCILSDAANGFVAGSPEMSPRHFPPFPAPDVIDSTGAGDAFRAGMLHGLSLNWDQARSLRFAAAAGSINCRALGATTGLPEILEIESLISENPSVARAYA